VRCALRTAASGVNTAWFVLRPASAPRGRGCVRRKRCVVVAASGVNTARLRLRPA